jgi:hypothetical protein
MKIELLFLVGAVFFVVDSMKDNRYTKAILRYKKHMKIAAIVFGLFSLYLFVKKNPTESTSMMGHLNGMIRYMPIDKESKDMLTPLFAQYRQRPVDPRLMKSGHVIHGGGHSGHGGDGVGGGATVRSVSGTKKKYVAANQDWKCGSCNQKLDAWFEVDHKVRLADGGSNHIDNLVALCRNCHGKKTLLENL